MNATGSEECRKESNKEEEEPELHFHDAVDASLYSPGTVKTFHLNLDQKKTDGVKGRKECFMKGGTVNEFLSDINCTELIGMQEPHDTLAMALTAIEQMHKLEATQPCLAWKPLAIIKKTLENTTQWRKQLNSAP